jgi:hypothetical protein
MVAKPIVIILVALVLILGPAYGENSDGINRLKNVSTIKAENANDEAMDKDKVPPQPPPPPPKPSKRISGPSKIKVPDPPKPQPTQPIPYPNLGRTEQGKLNRKAGGTQEIVNRKAGGTQPETGGKQTERKAGGTQHDLMTLQGNQRKPTTNRLLNSSNILERSTGMRTGGPAGHAPQPRGTTPSGSSAGGRLY